MSAAKHTPGPWQAAGRHIVQDDGGVVAYVTAYASLTPRQKADARLIASAPDLLAALQKALEHCIWPASSISAAEAEARAAIANATGEGA